VPSIAVCREAVWLTGARRRSLPMGVRQGATRIQPSARTWCSLTVTIASSAARDTDRMPRPVSIDPKTRSTSGSRMTVASSAHCLWRLPRSFEMTRNGSSPP
jgi:hypothetical protein